MSHRVVLCALAGTALAPSLALAQFTNSGFDTGNFDGWTITPTPGGTTTSQVVIDHDLDGPGGPLPSSLTGRFSVGRSSSTVPGEAGIELTQAVTLTGGTVYSFECDYGVFGPPPRLGGNSHGGRFAMIVDGQEIAVGDILSVNPNTHYSGHLMGQFTAPASGQYTVGVRITRHFTVPSELTSPLYQYVDNFLPSGPPPCYADCDTSTGVGVLDIFDFLCFQNRFASSAAYACECDTSTGPGVCDIFDFLCFQNAFAAGCP